MSAIEKIDEKKPTLSSLARDYLEQYDGNVEEAKIALFDELDGNKYLLSIVAEQAIMEAVNSYVSSVHRRKRASLFKSIVSRPLDFAKSVKRTEKENIDLALDFTLANGLKLRFATKEDVDSQAAMYARTAKDALSKTTFLKNISRLLKPGQIVGDVVSEAKAAKLMKESANV